MTTKKGSHQAPKENASSTARTITDTNSGNPDKPIHVAIIGGGIAGLYAAWRLKADQVNRDVDSADVKPAPAVDHNPSIKVALFEASGRLGGRLRSINIPGVAIPAELGAMRYTSRHRLLVGLVFKFFSDVYPKPFDFGGSTSFYVRGRRLPSEDLRSHTCYFCAAPIPFNLKECEKGKLPEELISDAIWNMLGELNFADSALDHPKVARIKREIRRRNVTKKSWRKIQEYGRFKDTHLYDIGFWNLLQHFLSNEAFLLAHDCLGYESIIGNWNAAEALEWFVNDFEPNQTQLMLPSGFESLVTMMTENIWKKEGGTENRITIETNHKLSKIERIGTGDKTVWKLYFEGADKLPISARHVILALPMRALESLQVIDENKPDEVEASWREFKEKHLAAVRPHRLFKLFLVYEHPWWLGHPLPGGDSGRVFTDLPIRQVYYFGPEWISKQATPDNIKQARKILVKPKNDLALVMASYSDSHYVNFWQPFSNKRKAGGPGSNDDVKYYRCRTDIYQDTKKLKDGKLREKFDKAFEEVKREAATERMVVKVQQQLAELHGVPIESIPEPIACIFMDWGAGEFVEGGWHTWEVHEEPWNFAENHLKKLSEEHLYICGEAYSREQGWIEGALKSTELALLKLKAKGFNVPRPQWLPNKDDFEEHIGLILQDKEGKDN